MKFRLALNVIALLASLTMGAGFALGGLRNVHPALVAFCFFIAAVALFVALLDLGYERDRAKRSHGHR